MGIGMRTPIKTTMECEYCGQNPHHPSCPNAEEPTALDICYNCGDGIFKNDTYYDVCGEIWCEYCIRACKETADG